MADSTFEHGGMDVHQQELTYRSFLRLAKWIAVYIAAAVLFFSMWFCTNAGLIGAFLATAVVLAVITLLLRERKGPGRGH